jgi:hypothetical protein
MLIKDTKNQPPPVNSKSHALRIDAVISDYLFPLIIPLIPIYTGIMSLPLANNINFIAGIKQ